MKKALTLVLVMILLSVAISHAQSMSTLTLRLGGPGAVMGRLITAYEVPGLAGPQPLGCDFEYQMGVNQYQPLTEAQTVCTAQIPTGSVVVIWAPTTSLSSADGWVVNFSSWTGCPADLSGGRIPDNTCGFDLKDSSVDLTANWAASSTPIPTPTATPNPKTVADQYVQGSSGTIGSSLTKLSIRKLAATKKLKISLGNAPGTGTFTIRLTATVKKRKSNAATMGALISTLVLAKITMPVQQGAPVNANLKFTPKGREYFAGRKTAKATLEVRYAPQGSGAVSSLLSKLTFRKR